MTFPDLLDAIWFHRGQKYKYVVMGTVALILFIL